MLLPTLSAQTLSLLLAAAALPPRSGAAELLAAAAARRERQDADGRECAYLGSFMQCLLQTTGRNPLARSGTDRSRPLVRHPGDRRRPPLAAVVERGARYEHD